jgi:glycosyltransferase involved in cell wall biosynthesis
MMEIFFGRLALQQRVLPAYRVPFFDSLASVCAGGVSVFAGEPLPEEQIAIAEQLQIARYTKGRNRHLFNPASSLYACWQAGLVAWLESWQPEALIVEANPRYRSTPQAVRWMHSRGRIVLGWGLGAPPLEGLLAGFRHRSRQAFLRSLDGLIAYSQRGADEYRALGFPADRVFVAYNAAAPRPVKPPPKRPPVFPSQPVVLFVGRLQARKRVDNLLHACAALPEGVRPRLMIVGDGPARGQLETLAKQVYPPAEFTGDQRGAELEACFAAADLFILPGTGGLAVQQAMASGLPVIVAEGDGTQDDLVRPENGWRVPPGDLPALTNAMQSALFDPIGLREKGKNAYRVIVEEINLEKMVEVFIVALSSSTNQPSSKLTG